MSIVCVHQVLSKFPCIRQLIRSYWNRENITFDTMIKVNGYIVFIFIPYFYTMNCINSMIQFLPSKFSSQNIRPSQATWKNIENHIISSVFTASSAIHFFFHAMFHVCSHSRQCWLTMTSCVKVPNEMLFVIQLLLPPPPLSCLKCQTNFLIVRTYFSELFLEESKFICVILHWEQHALALETVWRRTHEVTETTLTHFRRQQTIVKMICWPECCIRLPLPHTARLAPLCISLAMHALSSLFFVCAGALRNVLCFLIRIM